MGARPTQTKDTKTTRKTLLVTALILAAGVVNAQETIPEVNMGEQCKRSSNLDACMDAENKTGCR
jgi:hypothetical protein